MKAIVSIKFCALLLNCSPEKNHFSPVELFNVQEGEEFDLGLQQERLKYLRLLRPKPSGDKLVIPQVENVPDDYVNYVKAFVDTINIHLRSMPDLERTIVLSSFEKGSPEYLLLSTCFTMQDSSIVMHLTRDDASKLGLEKMYDEYFVKLYGWSKLAVSNAETRELQHSICEFPRSVFWSALLCNNRLGEYYYKLRDAVLELNRKIQ